MSDPHAARAGTGLVDPAAAWDALPADVQRQMGRLALTHLLALAALDDLPHSDRNLCRPFEVAEQEAMKGMEATLLDCVPDAETLLGRRLDLNQVGIRMCVGCGCTSDHACHNRCFWVGPHQCSNCRAEKGA